MEGGEREKMKGAKEEEGRKIGREGRMEDWSEKICL